MCSVCVTLTGDTTALREALSRVQAELQAMRRDRALEPVVDELTGTFVRHFDAEYTVLTRELRSSRSGLFLATEAKRATDREHDRRIQRFLAALAAAQAARASSVVQRIERELARAIRVGRLQAAQRLHVSVSFTTPQTRAVAWMKQHAAELIKGIDETTRKRVASIVTQAVEEGWSYAKTEQVLKELYDGFRKSVPQKHLLSRARLIAVHEAAMAYTQGELELGRWLAEGGLAVEKSWLTVMDERTCEVCSGNEGEGWIPLEQSFADGSEGTPGHVACRCHTDLRVAENPLAKAPAA